MHGWKSSLVLFALLPVRWQALTACFHFAEWI
jgi:hypothetical protein